MRTLGVFPRALALTLLACDAGPATPSALPHSHTGAASSKPVQPRVAAVQAAHATTPEPAPAALPEVPGLQRVTGAQLKAKLAAPGTRGLVVNVWASWCGSCKDEIPLLLQLSAAFAPEGVAFAFVTADQPADQARAVELMAGWKGPSPVLGVAGSLGELKRAMTPKWRGAIPATFLFDAQGSLRYFWEGPILEEEITPVLQRFLAGEVVDGELRTAAGPG